MDRQQKVQKKQVQPIVQNQKLNISKKAKPKLNIQCRKVVVKQEPANDPTFAKSTSTTESQNDLNKTEDELKLSTKKAFFQKYELQQKIGEGASGIVYKCIKKDGSGTYAVKVLRCEDEHFVILKNAYDTIKMLNHASIIKYKSIYILGNYRQAYLVMQLYQYPNLLHVKFKSEEQLQNVVYRILQAVEYMHELGLCHRDIKPDNILYNQSKGEIKIIDLGVSKQIAVGKFKKPMLTNTGTLYYKAPELFRSGFYDQLIDQWAVGITIYKLITGVTPFQSEYIQQTIQNIQKGLLQFNQPIWNQYSNLVKDFIRALLSPRQKRITAEKAKNSLWFTNGHKEFYQSMHRQKPKNYVDVEQSFHIGIPRRRQSASQFKRDQMIRTLKNKQALINKSGVCAQSDYEVSDDDQKQQEK